MKGRKKRRELKEDFLLAADHPPALRSEKERSQLIRILDQIATEDTERRPE